MAEPVKGRRAYDASGRRARAADSRRTIVDTAARLFLRDGYGHTTIAAIAKEARVSVETIYATFGTKGELLHRAWDVTVGGDDEAVLFHERPEAQDVLAEPDLRRRFPLHARISAATAERIGPFLVMVQAASGADPAAAAMLEEMGRQRYEGIGFMSRAAAATGQLAVSEEECHDVLWTTTDGMLWHRLVRERGWTGDRYAAWLGQLWVAALVGGPSP